MTSNNLLLRRSGDVDPQTGRDGTVDVAALESGVIRWGYEELNKAAEISREAGLPVHAHFGQMWALPLETAMLGSAVDASEVFPSDAANARPSLSLSR